MLVGAGVQAWAAPTAKAQVLGAIDRLVEIGALATVKEREELIRDGIVKPYLDLERICRESLGRVYDALDEAQRKQIVGDMKELLRTNLPQKLAAHPLAEGKVSVQQCLENEVGAMCNARLRREQGVKSLRLYLARTPGGNWRLFDVWLDGHSMNAEQRATLEPLYRAEGVAGVRRQIAEWRGDDQLPANP